jgi:hypothetical protein
MTTKRPLCNYDGTIKELASDDAVIGAGGLSYSLISANTQAVSGQGYLINASAGNVTLTLPATPSVGAIVAAVDAYNQSSTNTITLARNGSKIEGLADDLIFDVDGAGFTLVYVDSTRGWEIVSEIGQGGPSGLFEIDIDGGLMPVTDDLSDEYYELDANGDIQPIAA